MKTQDVLQHVIAAMKANGLDANLIKKITQDAEAAIDATIKENNLLYLKSERHAANSGGRPRALDKEKLKIASELMKNTQLSAREISNKLGISKATLYRYLKPDGSARNASFSREMT